MWPVSESSESIAAMSIIDICVFEWLPVVVIIGVQVHWIVTRPVFDAIPCGVRRYPMNTDGIDQLARAQIDHHPLRMRIFGFAGEMRIEIRITLPKRCFV